jgi:hypothetical protein
MIFRNAIDETAVRTIRVSGTSKLNDVHLDETSGGARKRQDTGASQLRENCSQAAERRRLRATPWRRKATPRLGDVPEIGTSRVTAAYVRLDGLSSSLRFIGRGDLAELNADPQHSGVRPLRRRGAARAPHHWPPERS